MSYNYDDAVSTIFSHRTAAYNDDEGNGEDSKSKRAEHLQKSVEGFTSLSLVCPMTPLLWMQYAVDASNVVSILGGTESESKKTECDILELGTEEYPGCALLRLRHLERLMQFDALEEEGGAAAAEAEAKEGKEEEGGRDSSSATRDKIGEAFEEASEWICSGSHRNECRVASVIYNLRVQFVASSTSDDATKRNKVVDILTKKARTPMKHSNDSLSDDVRSLASQHSFLTLTDEEYGVIEAGRMRAAKAFGRYAEAEDEVDAAMNEDGILCRYDDSVWKEDGNDDAGVGWETLLNRSQGKYLMGLGGLRSADAFERYAKLLSRGIVRRRKRKRDESDVADEEDGDDDETDGAIKALAVPVYERGVSECPTVESLWISYIRHLTSSIEAQGSSSPYLSLLKSVTSRSTKNCPYSVTLAKIRMDALCALAEANPDAHIFDPDEVVAVVKEVVDLGFVTSREDQLDLYLSGINAVKRRIMGLVSKDTTRNLADAHAGSTSNGKEGKGGSGPFAYDEPEAMPKKPKNGAPVERRVYGPPKKETSVEVADLIEDLRDLYDAADDYVRAHHNPWTEGRAAIWADRARTESCLLGPLAEAFDLEDDVIDGSTAGEREVVRCYEKLVRVHQPSHPDSYANYARYVLLGCAGGTSPSPSPGETLARIRKTRSLYQRSMVSVRREKPPPPTTKHGAADPRSEGTTANRKVWDFRDPNAALYDLCHEYLAFERTFGSEGSYERAAKLVGGKVLNFGAVQHQQQEQPQDAVMASTQKGTGESAFAMDVETKAGHGEEEEGATNAVNEGKSPDEFKPSPEASTPADRTESVRKDEPSTEHKTNLKVVKSHPAHRVHVGNLDYPAHPFTIHVTNLSPETQDMDLVDLFSECGAIVHARILRDRHHKPREKGKSRGEGLVQFEERESVEKALEMDDVVGLHEKTVRVGRSHVPAVMSLVPPGCHRVKPKGEGRSTKRNQKRREEKMKARREAGEAAGGDKASRGEQGPTKANVELGRPTKDGTGGGQEKPAPVSEKKKKPLSALSFRPRGLRGQAHRKVKVSLKDDDKK